MKGYIHIYCGDGKGKTTAALGLALRAAGAGKKVLLVRFMKTNSSSEVSALSLHANITVIPSVKVFGYFYSLTPAEKEQAFEYYDALLKDACKKAIDDNYDLLILDEITYAESYHFIDSDYLITFLRTKPEHLEVVITGKQPTQELLDIADYISDIKKVRHPYDKGVLPREGIEL
ncbi:cob(I)yrinic acid a,c-diamide adenosyltransferase [Anaerosporobacter sp.]|uniref:cob(I)yrinic acid a,c-diamide adenosyltransferase n=1 Tax=Anaerosporobacter sp. TaxID=1872529 RepID=UPI00286EE1A9|nr:cob(I)yrinic acid a,c-diamide adenosyltransferase [Anaerosporobacter sp.]